jgi:hypothetical protein
MYTAGWLPQWPAHTLCPSGMAPSSGASCGGSMSGSRGRAELRPTGVCARVLRPGGRPGLALLAAAWECEPRWWAGARAAAVAASVRRLCSTRIGAARRSWPLRQAKGPQDSPGPGLPSKDEPKRSTPDVFWPAVVTTHSSPAKTAGAVASRPCCRQNAHQRTGQAMTVEKNRGTGRSLPPSPPQRAIPTRVTRPLMATRAPMIRLSCLTVVALRCGLRQWKRAPRSSRGGCRGAGGVVVFDHDTRLEKSSPCLPYLTIFGEGIDTRLWPIRPLREDQRASARRPPAEIARTLPGE